LSEAGEPAVARPRLRWMFWLFIALMVALTGLFVALGLWQVQRLAEKEALMANVASRLDLAPVPLPPAGEWAAFDPEVFDYRPVSIAGRYADAGTALVFTSLVNPRGPLSGPGYWVMTPFALDGGGTVFVNRGFVPERMGESFARGGAVPGGPLVLTGIARASEAATSFTPAPDIANHIEWVRDTARLADLAGVAAGPVAPVYVDLPAGDPGALPQGGETVMSFPNNHLGYALTWFGFALITPVLLGFWIWRQLRPPRGAA